MPPLDLLGIPELVARKFPGGGRPASPCSGSAPGRPTAGR